MTSAGRYPGIQLAWLDGPIVEEVKAAAWPYSKENNDGRPWADYFPAWSATTRDGVRFFHSILYFQRTRSEKLERRAAAFARRTFRSDKMSRWSHPDGSVVELLYDERTKDLVYLSARGSAVRILHFDPFGRSGPGRPGVPSCSTKKMASPALLFRGRGPIFRY